MTYRIIADSCCDFSPEMYQQYAIPCAPLSVIYQGEHYPDFSGDQLRELYAGLRAGQTSSTSAVNPDGWARVMEPILAEGQDILVLAFSSGLSTTYQSAVIAAEDLRERFPQRTVRVVDTLAASMGQGLLVWHAWNLQQQGKSLDEVADWVEENKLHLCHWFTVDDLMFLKRGGRVSASTALVGTMLNIKPLLHVDNEGRLVSVSKCRGRKASIDALVKKVQELGAGYDNSTVFIAHGDCQEDAQYLLEQLRQKAGVENAVITYAGAVIGSHAGPGVLALFFMGDHR